MVRCSWRVYAVTEIVFFFWWFICKCIISEPIAPLAKIAKAMTILMKMVGQLCFSDFSHTALVEPMLLCSAQINCLVWFCYNWHVINSSLNQHLWLYKDALILLFKYVFESFTKLNGYCFTLLILMSYSIGYRRNPEKQFPWQWCVFSSCGKILSECSLLKILQCVNAEIFYGFYGLLFNF